MYQDKLIGRQCVKVGGTTQSKNFIQVPESLSKHTQLGYIGKFVYIQLFCPPGKTFNCHFEFMNADERDPNLYRLSVSNIAKETRTVSLSHTVRFNPQHKWTVLCLNLGQIAKKEFKIDNTIVTSLQLCGYCHYRGVFTSDQYYTPETLPKEMNFKLTKFENWSELYDFWLVNTKGNDLVKVENTQEILSPLKDDFNYMNLDKAKDKKVTIKTNAKPKKPVKTEEEKERNDEQTQKLERTLKYAVSPADALALSSVNCMSSPKDNTVYYSKNESDSNEIFYTGGSNIVKTNLDTNKQNIYPNQPINTNEKDRQDKAKNIAFSCQNQDGSMIAVVEEGKNPRISIFENQSKARICSFKSDVDSARVVTFNNESALLAVFGVDDHNRTKIVVYDISTIHLNLNEEPRVAATQFTDFDVQFAKFSPLDSHTLVSCGRENIRFLRIKNGHLPSMPVVLNHHARNSIFYSLDFEVSYSSGNYATDSSMKKLFVGNDKGLVFQVNYKTAELEGVYKCHESAIRAIKCNPAYVVTGSDDCYLRVWPFDFSEFFIEAKHSSGVTNVDIKKDGLKILACTATGNLGVLDVSTYEYQTKIRTNHSTVVDFDSVRNDENTLVVASINNTDIVKVYLEVMTNNINSNSNKQCSYMDQNSEFKCTDDIPSCLKLDASGKWLAVGFESGWIRVFDLANTSINNVLKISDTQIQTLHYHKDLLFSLNYDTVAVHDICKNYQPVKMFTWTHAPQYKCIVSTKLKNGEEVYATIGEKGREIVIYDMQLHRLRNKIKTDKEIRQICFIRHEDSGDDALVVLTESEFDKVSAIQVFSISDEFTGKLLLTLNDPCGTRITTLEVQDDWSHFYCGTEKDGIYVFNSAILDLSYDRKVNRKGQTRVFNSHSGSVVKIQSQSDRLVSRSDNNDGFLVWQSNGKSITKEFATKSLTYNIHDKNRNNGNSFYNKSTDIEDRRDLETEEEDKESCDLNRNITTNEITKDNQGQNQEEEYTFDKTDTIQLGSSLVNNNSKLQTLSHSYMLGFNGQNAQCFDWSKSKGCLTYICNNFVIKENLNSKSQLLFEHKATVEHVLVNAQKDFLYTVTYEGNSIEIHQYNNLRANLIKSITINENQLKCIDLDSSGSTLLISTETDGKSGLYIYDSELNYIKACQLLNQSIRQCKWSSFNPDVFLGLFDRSLRLFRLNQENGEIEQKEVNLGRCAEVLGECVFTTFTEVVVGKNTTNVSYLIYVGTTLGSIYVFNFKTCELEYYTECIYGGEINYIGVFGNRSVLGGSTHVLNSYAHDHLDSCYNARQSLFCSKPDVLVLDNAVSEVSLLNNEGLVATRDSTIWYVNFETKAPIRLVSSHVDQLTCVESNWQYFATSSCDRTVRVWQADSYDQVVAFRQKNVPKVLKFSAWHKNILFVGNDNGSLNVLSISEVKALQTLPLVSSAIVSILELDEMTLLVVGSLGEMNLLYSSGSENAYENYENHSPSRNLKESKNEASGLVYQWTEFPSLGYRVTHVAQSEFEPEYRFLVCTDNGFVTTYIRTSDERGLKKGVQAEFTSVDSYNAMENPHGLTDPQEILLNAQLYKYKRQVGVVSDFLGQDRLLATCVDALQYLFVRDYDRKLVLQRLPLTSFPVNFVVWSESVLLLTTTEGSVVKLDLKLTDKIKTKTTKSELYELANVNKNTKTDLTYESTKVHVNRNTLKMYFKSGENVVVRKLI